MAKLTKKQTRVLIFLAVAALAAYWAWAKGAKTHEHGGTSLKAGATQEHGGKEHAGQ